MNPNKALWEKGDFTRIADTMRESGEALIKSLGIAKGLKMLDLGCGDGTTAIPAAKLGADVLGVDIARNLVEAPTWVGLDNFKTLFTDEQSFTSLKNTLELTAFIGFANLATRSNAALGIESQGFSAACEVPLAARPAKAA